MTQVEKQSAVMDIIEYLQVNYLDEYLFDHTEHLDPTYAEREEIRSMTYKALDKAYHSV